MKNDEINKNINTKIKESLLVPGVFLFVIGTIAAFSILPSYFQLKQLIIPLIICVIIAIIGCVKVGYLITNEDEIT